MPEPEPKKSIRKRALIVILTLLFIGAVCIGASLFYDYMLRLNYPLKYDEYILEYSGQCDLDPYLVAAMIDVESGFHPDALSNRGAVGLMQLMPETGEWVYRMMGKGSLDIQDLDEPEINIMLGCNYLKYLDEKYDSIHINVLAAYNAGNGRVDGWLENRDYSKDGKTLDHIPFKETAEYVQKVEGAYEKYKALYQDRLGKQ